MAKVLVADDQIENRHLLEEALREWGYEVVAVNNGYEALRELLTDPAIILAIVDREISGMSGLQVCRAIQSLDRAVFTLVTSATDTPEEAQHALDAGASGCLRKPVELEELKDRLEQGVPPH